MEPGQLSWVASSRKRQVGTVGLVAALVLAGFVFLPPDKLIAAIRPARFDRSDRRWTRPALGRDDSVDQSLSRFRVRAGRI